MPINKVLLIGNDINSATQKYSWKMLLKDLVQHAQLGKELNMDGKPFPLLYEEIFLNAARQYGTREKHIKSYIAVKTQQLEPGSIHQKIIDLGVPVLLTTNYDLTLECLLTQRPHKIANAGVLKENLYSLYRVNQLGNYKLWHIHGNALHPQSITLGYEHYSGYLQQMRNYVVTGTHRGHRQTSLLQRLKEGNVTHTSWIDYFFTHDVHIIGLNLDFVEIHLWWLLTFRARARLQNAIGCLNKIYYYYPQKYFEKSLHKLELLNVNEVVTVPLVMKAENRVNYYDRVLKLISSTH